MSYLSPKFANIHAIIIFMALCQSWIPDRTCYQKEGVVLLDCISELGSTVFSVQVMIFIKMSEVCRNRVFIFFSPNVRLAVYQHTKLQPFACLEITFLSVTFGLSAFKRNNCFYGGRGGLPTWILGRSTLTTEIPYTEVWSVYVWCSAAVMAVCLSASNYSSLPFLLYRLP